MTSHYHAAAGDLGNKPLLLSRRTARPPLRNRPHHAAQQHQATADLPSPPLHKHLQIKPAKQNPNPPPQLPATAKPNTPQPPEERRAAATPPPETRGTSPYFCPGERLDRPSAIGRTMPPNKPSNRRSTIPTAAQTPAKTEPQSSSPTTRHRQETQTPTTAAPLCR
ncbi:hypothetical protein RHMOL_Rhmol09G0130600 [Rhododendron molle]|uniref:Uncharacterized protein n=1 Tax=Rhododendron molle TaxID=49168 RepID=A0ACC0MCN2_RHOML|nr:hypothetical protein RHMOL_Rhmol09G0130600 [Rhododendron molle]